MRRIYTLATTGETLHEGVAFFDGAYYRPAEFLSRATEAELNAANVTVDERPDLPPAPLTTADVDRERDRRLATVTFQGRAFNFIDGKGSDANIAGMSTLALGAIIRGAQPGDLRWADPDQDFAWVALDNTSVPMDAQTVYAFGQAVAVWKARHIRAARTIKDLPEIPGDFHSDHRWPA